jgi:hypothetical protein
MKVKILLLISFFVLFSCKKTQNTNIDLNDNLYKILLNYQKKNPLPSKENTNKTSFLVSKNLKYVYEVYFFKEKDSSLYVTLNPSGANFEEESYGIYQDELLKPTYIIDSIRIGNKFVKNYKKEGLSNYILKNAPIIDVIYPTYIYKIKGNKLILSDSIRGNIREND